MEGDDVLITANFDLSSLEFINITQLEINLTGPVNKSCTFDIEGKKISDCEGMKIEKISQNFSFGFGYGYGFTNGSAVYNISIKSKHFSPGNYTPIFSVMHPSGAFSTVGSMIEVRREKCNNMLGEDGTVLINGSIFDEENRLHMKIHSIADADGKGKFSAKEGNMKFDYKFDLTGINRNTPEWLIVNVSGMYDLKKNKDLKDVPANATIYFDVVNNKVNVASYNFNATDIDLVQFCE